MKNSMNMCLLLLIACGGSGSSPEAVYEKCKSSSKSRDWKGVFNTFDPDQTGRMLAMLAQGMSAMSMMNPQAKQEYERIRAKHAIPDLQEKMGQVTTKEAYEQASKEVISGVKDRAELYADLMVFMEKHGGPQNKMDFGSGGTLSSVTLNGDSASGTVAMTDGKTYPINFVRRSGRWYVSPGW